jgi:hypothetical protein
MRVEREQIERVEREWFAEHEATLEGESGLMWKRPNSWNYAVRYSIFRETLFVAGDLGCAAYQWSEAISFHFLTGCDLSYFHGKCVASEVGRAFNLWSEHRLRKGIEERGRSEWRRLLKNGCSTQHADWTMMLHEEIQRRRLSFDDAAELAELGWVIHPRCVGHWLGIRMAVKQLEVRASELKEVATV